MKNLMKFVFFYLTLWINCIRGQLNECETNFLCTEDFSSSPCAPQNCDIPNSECYGILLPLYDNINDYCSSCPLKCVTYLKEGDICRHNVDQQTPEEMCGPGLVCDRGQSVYLQCVPSKTKCIQSLIDYNDRLSNGEVGMNESPPSCDMNGFYEPLQCYQSGLCRCVDKFSGDPIFGVTGSEADSTLSSQDCRCARQFVEDLELGCKMTTSYFGSEPEFTKIYKEKYDLCMERAMDKLDSDFFLHNMRCLPNGNYDPIQCMTNDIEDEEKCFCIDEDINLNSTITYQSLILDLPCYDEEIHVPYYLRPCEIEKQILIKAKSFDIHNQSSILYDEGLVRKCTPDGFYYYIQHKAHDYDELYCSDRNGYQIEEFGAIRGTPEGDTMNCECALTRENLSPSSPKPTCCSNGNFRRIQCQAGLCFCVDNYGRQHGKEVDQLYISDLECSSLSSCTD